MPAHPQPSVPPIAASCWRRGGRLLARLLLLGWFVFGATVLLLRELVLPGIGQYRAEIAALATEALGVPVSIATLEGDWRGLHPRLHLQEVLISDAAGRAALQLPRVDATLSWSSLLHLRPHFRRLEIHAPALSLRRETDGSLLVAGLKLGGGADSGGALDWVLQQREIVIHDAVLRWTDALRAAPELRLDQVQFRLERRLLGHRFALQARPPAALASTLDLRGEVRGLDVHDPWQASAKFYLALERADLGGWQAWADYPLPMEGSGGLRAWLDVGAPVGDARSLALVADVVLAAVRTRLDPDLPELQLEALQGRVSVTQGAGRLNVSTAGLQLHGASGLRLAPTDFELSLSSARGPRAAGGRVRANRLDFAALAALAAHLPLPQELRAQLAAFAPQGRLDGLRLDWRGEVGQPQTWSLSTDFSDIGLHAREGLPGLGGLAGHLEGNERGGRFHLDARDVHIDLPEVFESSRLAFSVLRADGGWQHPGGGRLEIALDSASFENPDAAGHASGRYWPQPGGAGEIDLQARLTRAEGTSVWRYLPRVVNRDTHEWVRNAIRHARVPDTRLQLKGRLADFPFRDGNGRFLVAIQVEDGQLDYASGWPAIEAIQGEVRFEGPGMRIEARRGRIFGVELQQVVADVPDLDQRPSEVMTITGQALGPTADFLRFVSASPVAGRIDHFTDDMRAEGKGRLDLRLVMPLRSVDQTSVEGRFHFAANRLWLIEGLPALEAAAGQLDFTADTLAIPEARARLLGEPFKLTARTETDGGVRFEAQGSASVEALTRELAWARELPLLGHLSGSAPWQAEVRMTRGGTRVAVRSALEGLSASLPEPFNKRTGLAWPLRVELDHPAGGGAVKLAVELADRLAVRLERDAGSGDLRGGIGLFQPVRSAERGVMISAQFDTLDVDHWRRVLALPEEEEGEGRPASPGLTAALAGVALQAREMRVFGQTLSKVHLRALADPGGWRARLDSDVAAGEFDWRHAGDGTLKARFRHLVLAATDGEPREHSAEAEAEDEAPPRQLPGLDIVAERFALRGKDLGRLEVFARNRDRVWLLERLSLESADGRLSGRGQWRTPARSTAPRSGQLAERALTQLDFKLALPDAGRFSLRLGYPDAVRGGPTTLSGRIRWQGAPTRLHYPSLSGAMTLEVGPGQFNKLEPGVGRLLGILSLQSLSRRVTLDFRDVFSEGFAFDRISGSIEVDAGVLRTEDLEIRGPAARVSMQGSADLDAETQALRVIVQPTLSESVAVGAAAGLVNPVAGVVAYLAQKVLSDPIEKIFAYEYAITGSWSEPLVSSRGRARLESGLPAVPRPDAGAD